MIKELGIKPVINCAGTLTVLGGNTVDPEIIDAMKEAAGSFFDMPELHRRAGEYIARMLGAEDAYIVNGAEAGIILSLAACMTQGDINNMTKLPGTSGMKDEVLVQSPHRNMYDYPLGFTGAKIVEVGGNREAFERAINDQTVASVYFVYDPRDGVLPLPEVSRTCHERNIPVIADAAAELPPKENFTKFLKQGADLVVFSGGKDIGAPNDTGLILGRKDLIRMCRNLGPHSYLPFSGGTHVFIGRPMKTSKEDIFAFLAALQKYLNADESARMKQWEQSADYLIEELGKFANIAGAKKIYEGPGQPRPLSVPKVELELFTETGITAEQILHDLKNRDPPIVAYTIEGKFYLNTQCLKLGEEKIVADRIRNILRELR